MANLDHMTTHFRPELAGLREHEEMVDNILTQNLTRHLTGPFGELQFQPNNPEYGFQRMDCVKVTGEGADAAKLRLLASFVYPGIGALIKHLVDERGDALDDIAEEISNRNDVTALTDHLDVRAVAIAGGALLCALDESGRINIKDLNSELIVSSMMKRTTLHGQPTPGLITQAYKTLRFSLPTANENNREIPKEIREPFNKATQDDINETAESEVSLRSLAGSGTGDRKIGRVFGSKRRPPIVHMGPLSPATREMVERTKVLGIGLDTTSDEPEFYVGELVDAINLPGGAHDVMHDIARGMTNNSSTEREYHETREAFEEAAPKKKKTPYAS